MPSNTIPMQRKRNMPTNTLSKPAIGKNYGSDAYSGVMPSTPSQALRMQGSATSTAAEPTPPAQSLNRKPGVQFGGNRDAFNNLPNRIDVPDINGGRTFAMRDAALADNEQYSLAAAEAAANSAMSPAGYGEFDGGLNHGARDRVIGERKNQTVLQAQLQGDRDKLSLDYLTSDNSARQNWAKLALDNRDSIRSGNQQDRQLDLADLEAQYGQSNKDREFGRQTGLDEYGYNKDKFMAEQGQYEFGQEQYNDLQKQQMSNQYNADQLAATEAGNLRRDQHYDAVDAAAAAKAGKLPPKGAGYYEGILERNGLLKDASGNMIAPPAGFKDTLEVFQNQHPDWSDEQLAASALEASGGAPSAENQAKQYAAFEGLRNMIPQTAAQLRQSPSGGTPNATAPENLGQPQQAAPKQEQKQQDYAPEEKQAGLKQWLTNPKNREHPNYQAALEDYYNQFGSPFDAPTYQRSNN